MTTGALTTLSSQPDDTAHLAIRFGAYLQPGDTLLLQGNVGAGKSLFARALIQSLQTNPEDVPSPTFTLVQTYETSAGDIWHCDLYRLSDPDEAFELGLVDAMENDICLIEWPDRLGDLAPKDALVLTFATGPNEDARRITLTGGNQSSITRLKAAFDE